MTIKLRVPNIEKSVFEAYYYGYGTVVHLCH